ncbi:MAG: ABC transporter permease [Anaerolineaceae bacterium]|nr:ABC transporter permease [Anaerolineaceae bacterium]
MNWQAIWAIVGKDWKVIRQSRMVILPIVVVPLVILVVLPGILGLVLAHTEPGSPEMTKLTADMQTFFDNLPPRIRAVLDEFPSEIQQTAVLFFQYIFAPLYLILPIMVASVIAADSFVGEKERKTLEALIYTPTSDRELYVAKMLTPWLLSVAVSILGAVVYAVVVNVALWPIMGRVFFPNLAWILLAVWVSPAAAGLGLGAIVLVSSRVSTFMEAQQAGGFMVLPVIVLVLSQLAGILYFGVELVIGLGAILWVIDAVILWYGARHFQRGELMARL